MSTRKPELYRATLEAHIAVHEQEIEELHAAIEVLGRKPPKGPKESPPAEWTKERREYLERRLAAHARLIELARQPGIPTVLTEIAASPELAQEAARDPVAFADARGIVLPASAEVVVEAGMGYMHIRVSSVDEDAPFSLVWTPGGFLPPPDLTTRV